MYNANYFLKSFVSVNKHSLKKSIFRDVYLKFILNYYLLIFVHYVCKIYFKKTQI